jgi:hypothetical protein
MAIATNHDANPGFIPSPIYAVAESVAIPNDTFHVVSGVEIRISSSLIASVRSRGIGVFSSTFHRSPSLL